MSFDRFTTQAAALALAAFTTAGLLGSVDRIAAHEQHRAATELLAQRQAPERGLQFAEVQHVEVGVQHVEVNAHLQHVVVTARRPA
jgi:predicted nucleotidyltransferase